MNSKQIGDISEAFVTAHFLKAGFTVLKPIGDNLRYDMVIDRGKGFETVQVKTACFLKARGVLHIPLANSYGHRGRQRKSYQGEVDLIAAWSPDFGEMYLIEIKTIGNMSGIYLRIAETKNRQVEGVKMAKDYVFTIEPDSKIRQTVIEPS